MKSNIALDCGVTASVSFLRAACGSLCTRSMTLFTVSASAYWIWGSASAATGSLFRSSFACSEGSARGRSAIAPPAKAGNAAAPVIRNTRQSLCRFIAALRRSAIMGA